MTIRTAHLPPEDYAPVLRRSLKLLVWLSLLEVAICFLSPFSNWLMLGRHFQSEVLMWVILSLQWLIAPATFFSPISIGSFLLTLYCLNCLEEVLVKYCRCLQAGEDASAGQLLEIGFRVNKLFGLVESSFGLPIFVQFAVDFFIEVNKRIYWTHNVRVVQWNLGISTKIIGQFSTKPR